MLSAITECHRLGAYFLPLLGPGSWVPPGLESGEASLPGLYVSAPRCVLVWPFFFVCGGNPGASPYEDVSLLD